MEGVGVIIAVGHALDLAEALAVDLDKAAGQAFRRGGDQREIQAVFFARLIHALAHVADDLEAEVLRLVALAVVLADQRLERLRQADEAQGQRAVLEHLADRVVRTELVRVDPHALAHQEGIVAHLLGGLDLKAGEQLVDHQIDLAVEVLKEPVDVAVAADRDARQVDRGKRQVAAAVDDLARGVEVVADDAGAAAHVSRLGLRMAGLVILLIERRIQEREVREHALGRHAAGQLEQVVVGVALVVVDALLDLEDVDREDRGLAVAQTGLGGEQQLLHHQPPLGRGIRAVVERGERDLRARARVHGVQVVHQCLHRLIGRLAGLLVRILAGKAHTFADLLLAERFPERRGHRFVIAVAAREAGPFAGLLLDLLGQRLRVDLVILIRAKHLKRLGEVVAELLAEGLFHARGHRVVEVRHRLAAVLVVLVGLDRDARERCIRADVVRLTQEAVTGREAALKQFEQVDLAAGRGQRQEVQIVDVDIALAVRLGMRRIEDEHLVELLGALRAVLEHGAHRGVAVNVRVLALDVVFERGLEGQVLVHLHQSGVHLAHAGALVAVEDVLFRRAGVAALDQHLLHCILYLLDRRDLVAGRGFQHLFDLLGEAARHLVILTARGLRCAENRIGDFLNLKGGFAPVAFDNLLDHVAISLFHTKTALRRSQNFVAFSENTHHILCLCILL